MSNKTVNQRAAEEWIRKYGDVRPTHERFCAKLQELLKELLSKESVKYQVVEKRAKSIESFAEKLQRNGKSYTDPLREMTDLSGLRIILYHVDDIDKVCTLLDREFSVDDSRSIDQRALLAPDQFGYLSVHKIVSLSEVRAQLPEWSEFRGLVAEVQVRTVLQHAWAAISHTLQYKRERDIPRQLRRRLYRVSGLLETADEQLATLRKEQLAFEEEVAERVKERGFDIAIDLVSLQRLLPESRAANTIRWAVRRAGLFESTVVRAYSQLIFVCDTVPIRGFIELDEELASLEAKANSFFTTFAKGHKGYTGSPEHWLAVILVGAHREKFSPELLESELSWDEEYARDVLAAGQVFEDTQ